jgi:hypothetical protein
MNTADKLGRKAGHVPGRAAAPAGTGAPNHRVPYTPPARVADHDPHLERWLHGGVTLEEACRVRAYHLWERAGRPPGDGVEFWLDAERQLTAAG